MKIIQILNCTFETDDQGCIIGLADDGSLWEGRFDGVWRLHIQPLKDQIEGDKLDALEESEVKK